MSRVSPSISPFLSRTLALTLSLRLPSHHGHRVTCRSMNGSSSMTRWWKRALGQRLNTAGVASFVNVVAREPQLALPHLAVPDIRWVDWAELARLGFRGVVFDKDNTLTAPYSPILWSLLAPSFHRCRSAFPGRIAVFSNSAGLYQYDPDGSEARALEESIGGIHVIRHAMKKPAGTAEEIEKYFGCSSSLLVMVGDRPFTDVVYGNRNGFLTILTEPLSLSGEPFIVKQCRRRPIEYDGRLGGNREGPQCPDPNLRRGRQRHGPHPGGHQGAAQRLRLHHRHARDPIRGDEDPGQGRQCAG